MTIELCECDVYWIFKRRDYGKGDLGGLVSGDIQHTNTTQQSRETEVFSENISDINYVLKISFTLPAIDVIPRSD